MVDRYLVTLERPIDDSLYGVYETLIEKWLQREGEKRRHSAERPAFIESLRRVSQETAMEVYRNFDQNWHQHRRFHLTRDEAVAIAVRHGIELRPEEVTGQSLLTCDGAGNWKFAHKSILEFFLAKAVLDDPRLLTTFPFAGMDVVRQFLVEKNTLPLLVPIKGGEFLMGSPETEPERRQDETQPDKRNPVLHVSWNDAAAYCAWLSALIGAPCRLPTEAEWEYACRAGTQSPFYTGNQLTTAQANYDGNFPYNSKTKGKYLARTTPVGSYPPNDWGLYDMHGNVWEWCSDRYGEKYYEECQVKGVADNPAGPATGDDRVLRGGSGLSGGRRCRAAARSRNAPEGRDSGLGFRLVSSLQSVG